jgi:outer membrane protein OmpA-like peptidoglycan-associated protein
MHLSRLQGDTSNRLEITRSKFYSDEKDWVLITKEFVANGTENFMIIGNFKANKRTQRFQTKRNITKGSYYYLDMVSVQKTDSHENNVDSTLVTNFKLDSVHVFQEVFFDFNKTTPKVRYQKELHVILDYLKLHPNLKIRISGHTDNVGSDAFNQELSLKRSKAVANFLITNGVLQSRIEHEGFGSSKPISSNKTKAGRLRNRRVEFILRE